MNDNLLFGFLFLKNKTIHSGEKQRLLALFGLAAPGQPAALLCPVMLAKSEEENSRLQADLALAQSQKGELKTQLDQERQELSDKLIQLDRLQADLALAQSQKGELQTQLDQERQELSGKQVQLDLSHQQPTAAQAQLATMQAQLDLSQQQHAETKAQLAAMQQDWEKARQVLAETSLELERFHRQEKRSYFSWKTILAQAPEDLVSKSNRNRLAAFLVRKTQG